MTHLLTPDQERRFFSRVRLTGSGCWEWTGALNQHGYGVVRRPGERTNILTHRLTIAEYGSGLPEGCEVHHKCRNRCCCNPAHLEAVTRRTHPDNRAGINAAKTHCIHGHKFTPENTYNYRGHRHCRACRSERDSALRANPSFRQKRNARARRRRAEGRR